jgi:hypothetical protein
MRGKGINYDTGFFPGGRDSRPHFDGSIVRREMRVIAQDLRCTAVRITGGEPARLTVAAEAAAAAGLEVWFAPFPCELTTQELAGFFADCAERAEQVRRGGATVVFVAGCELSLFCHGFVPGGTVYERIAGVQKRGLRMLAAFARMPGKLNPFLAETADSVRTSFGGPVTYASGTWEPVRWGPFDIVAVDAYRDASNAATFRASVREHGKHGKPVVVTEFGCCPYQGAADRGGMGWAIVDSAAEPPRLRGEYEREESEQVRYLRELYQVFAEEGVDLMFWFTFAGYDKPCNPDPALDLDLASYGVVTMLGTGGKPGQDHDPHYEGLGWRTRPVFSALAGLEPSAAP